MIVVKKFSADWCGPCRQLTPIIKTVMESVTGTVIETIDVDDDYEAAMKYGVRSVPTVVIEKNGKEVKRFVGLQSGPTYISAINEAKNLDN